MSRIEGFVQSLEGEDLPLEAAIEAYERGFELIRRAHAKLSDAERRIEQLNERGERMPLSGTDPDDTSGGSSKA